MWWHRIIALVTETRVGKVLGGIGNIQVFGSGVGVVVGVIVTISTPLLTAPLHLQVIAVIGFALAGAAFLGIGRNVLMTRRPTLLRPVSVRGSELPRWRLKLAELHDQGTELLDELRSHPTRRANEGTKEALTRRYVEWDRECQRVVESSPGFRPGDWAEFDGNDGRLSLDLADDRFPTWVREMASNVDRRLQRLRRYASGEPIMRWG
jgi:hypothetical protein